MSKVAAETSHDKEREREEREKTLLQKNVELLTGEQALHEMEPEGYLGRNLTWGKRDVKIGRKRRAAGRPSKVQISKD